MPFKSTGDEELESLLNKATSPNNAETNWEAIMGFCDQVNKELEGCQIAVRLLAHKLQSPQEKEALYALTVLETCVRNCGKVFHQEIGKFKFLNEIIKVVSPKYLGNLSSERVKQRCIEILYSWSKGLPHEPKINEAYGMLKKQGIVRQDPAYVDQKVVQEQEQVRLSQQPPPPPKPDSLFSDEEKSKQLSKLLRSKNPDDLIAANRLIKSIVKEDNDRMEKLSKRMTDLETVKNNAKLLADMLDHYSAENSVSDLEIMKELYSYIETARPNLFRLASETDPSDSEGIQEILRVNDDASDVLKRYKDTVNEEAVLMSDNKNDTGGAVSASNVNLLSDLGLSAPPPLSAVAAGLGAPPPYTPQADTNLNGLQLAGAAAAAGTTTTTTNQSANSANLLEDDLEALGLGAAAAAPSSTSNDSDLLQDLLSGPVRAPVPVRAQKPVIPAVATKEKKEPIKGFEDIDILGQQLMQEIKTSDSAPSAARVLFGQNTTAAQLADVFGLGSNKNAATAVVSDRPASSNSSLDDAPLCVLDDPTPAGDILPPLSPPRSPSPPSVPPCNLDALTVELATVVPHPDRQPRTLMSRDGVTLSLHFAQDRPHPYVSVHVVTVTSTCSHRLRQVTFQAAVPKHMKLKLQSPTSTELAPSSPFLPPSAASQIMLIQNCENEKVRLKYRLVYQPGELEAVTEVGEIDLEPELLSSKE